MGRITVYLPQQFERTYKIRNAETAQRLIASLDEIVELERDEEDDILGIWSPPKRETPASRPQN